MFVSRRIVAVPTLAAQLATHAILHGRYRVHVVHNRGLVSEDRLVLGRIVRLGALSRPILTVVLEGRARIAACGSAAVWLEPGDLALLEHKEGVEVRQEGSPFVSLSIEWDSLFSGATTPRGLSVGRLPARDVARLRCAARAMMKASDPVLVAPALADVIHLVDADGVALGRPDPGDLVEPVAPAALALSAALDRALSDLGARPMSVDLEHALGRSPRQVHRDVSAFNARYGFNAGTWRDTRDRRRLLVGTALMSVAGATTERVARAVGFSSPTAFCRAMANAGLPSPGNVRGRVLDLR